MSDAILAVRIAARSVLVAARLRAHMERRGYVLREDGPGADGLTLRLVPEASGATWVFCEPPEAADDDLGKAMSAALRCGAI